MSKTNYRECWWLVKVMDGDLGPGSFRKGTGYTLRNLNDFRSIGSRIDWVTSHSYDTDVDEETRRSKDKFRQTVMRWRTSLYNEFGLAILMESTPGADNTHGYGGYYYYLANPELLDEKGKTLKEHIQFLADSETHRDSWVTVGQIEKHYRARTASMGYISSGGAPTYGYLSKEGTSYRTILGEENLELIQFAMQFGEVLTIRFGKVRAGIDINAPYSFEPYQLKEIEGRWYVIGNLYPLGHKESAEIAVYDLARLAFADEDNPDVIYEPVKGFDVNDDKTWADICQRNNRYLEGGYWLNHGVCTIDIMTHTEEFAKYLSDHPLCSAQEEISKGQYRIYTTLTTETFVMFGAYGAELSFNVIPKDYPDNPGLGEVFAHEIQSQLNYFRKIGD